jgi:molybdate transport system substrate-binding protein
MFRRLTSAFLATGLFLAGCGDDTSGASTGDEVTVFAATSLTGAFSEIGEAFEAANPSMKVTFNFAASSALAQQVLDGGGADVFASADEANLAKLADAKLTRPSAVFARNRLVTVAKRGNPRKIRTLADLATTEGVVSLCGLAAPCGAYAAEALRHAGVDLAESRVTRGQNAAVTLTAVTQGDAVAAIVYATDAQAAGALVTTVAIPDAHNVIARYPIAVLRATPNASAARAFVAYVRSDAGQRVLARFGFLSP